jgi:hypothetical protein
MNQNFTIRIKRPTSLLLVAAVAACISLAPRVYGVAPAGPCSTNAESRALDFWLGDWNIAGPGSSATAKSQMIVNRVRIVRIGPDKVEQIWEKSSDHGATWTAEFRGEYSRKKS